MAGLPLEVDDGPVLLPLLNMAKIEIHCLAPSETTGEQDSQQAPRGILL